MNKLMTGALAALIAVACGFAVAASPLKAVAQGTPAPNFGTPPTGSIPILYNDQHVYTKPDILKQSRVLAAQVRNGTILIPLRSMFEQMGATVSYDPSTQTVTVQKAGAEVQVTVGKPVVMLNGEPRPLDVPPIMWHGTVLVPVRVISEGMGAYVQWVPDRHIVVVRYIPATPPPPPPATPAPPPPTPAPTPSPTPPSWTGLYIGANGGWGLNNDRGRIECVTPDNAAPPSVFDGKGCPVPSFGGMTANGLVYGGQLGYNWQIQRALIGLEGDYDGANIHGSESIAGPFPLIGGGSTGPATFTASEKIQSFATARLRLGVLLSDSALLYVTGGLAQAHVQLNSDFIVSPNRIIFRQGFSFPGSANVTRSGWAYGGGLEFALSRSLTFKIEGLGYNLQPYTILAPEVPAVAHSSLIGKQFEFSGNVIRGGFNWRF